MKTIGLILENRELGIPRLFRLLEEVFPVRFDLRANGDYDSIDGVIFAGAKSSRRTESQRANLPCLILQCDSRGKLDSARKPVDFGLNGFVPPIFRARSIGFSTDMEFFEVASRKGDAVLADIAGCPVWVACDEGGRRLDIAGVTLPEVAQQERLSAQFNETNFFRLLPLIDYLRRLSGESAWTQAPLRACFMFDDPNLHSLHYGYLDYRQLAREASEHNYHVALATIPLDTWLTNRRVASFLLEQKRWLSLLIHGNDHGQDELAQRFTGDERLRRLAQALERMERLEERTGIEVSRIMAAPYGACRAEALRDMAKLGYEAICITSGSLWTWNSDSTWASALGLRAGEIVEGLPVIPRFGLRADCSRSILLAAYLGQAIVLVGHHQDVRHGLGSLAELAAFINSLGEVSWGNLRVISRSNFAVLHDRDVLRLRMYTKWVELEIPAGVQVLVIDRPWSESRTEPLTVTANQRQIAQATGSAHFPVCQGDKVVVRSIALNSAERNKLPAPNLRLWPVIRRQMSECRDRAVRLWG